jgi:protein phosphatase
MNILKVDYTSSGLTDIGQHREENQDAFLIDDEINLYLVADGLGGLDYGREASEYAVKHLSLFIKAG